MAAWETWGKSAGGSALKFPFCDWNKRTRRKARGAPLYRILWSNFWTCGKRWSFRGNRTHGSMVSSMFSLLWPHRAAFDVRLTRFEVTWLCPIESFSAAQRAERRVSSFQTLCYVVLTHFSESRLEWSSDCFLPCVHYPGQKNLVCGILSPEMSDFSCGLYRGGWKLNERLMYYY